MDYQELTEHKDIVYSSEPVSESIRDVFIGAKNNSNNTIKGNVNEISPDKIKFKWINGNKPGWIKVEPEIEIYDETNTARNINIYLDENTYGSDRTCSFFIEDQANDESVYLTIIQKEKEKRLWIRNHLNIDINPESNPAQDYYIIFLRTEAINNEYHYCSFSVPNVSKGQDINIDFILNTDSQFRTIDTLYALGNEDNEYNKAFITKRNNLKFDQNILNNSADTDEFYISGVLKKTLNGRGSFETLKVDLVFDKQLTDGKITGAGYGNSITVTNASIKSDLKYIQLTPIYKEYYYYNFINLYIDAGIASNFQDAAIYFIAYRSVQKTQVTSYTEKQVLIHRCSELRQTIPNNNILVKLPLVTLISSSPADSSIVIYGKDQNYNPNSLYTTSIKFDTLKNIVKNIENTQTVNLSHIGLFVDRATQTGDQNWKLYAYKDKNGELTRLTKWESNNDNNNFKIYHIKDTSNNIVFNTSTQFIPIDSGYHLSEYNYEPGGMPLGFFGIHSDLYTISYSPDSSGWNDMIWEKYKYYGYVLHINPTN